jgi:hypothetical protein
MMPQLVTVRVQRRHARPSTYWLPVLPLLALAAVAAVVACLVFRISVPRALKHGWRVAAALSGTQVDIGQGRTAVLVSFN